MKATPVERFWSKVNKTDTCWLWTAGRDRSGYGAFKVNGRQTGAHRFAYELLVGPIPDGLELDHVRERGCTNRHCVNPAHLEPVTSRENTFRSDISPSARFARRTHCDKGHPLSGDNLMKRGDRKGRACRTCHNEASRLSMQRHRTRVTPRE